jgi:hypothetical protein
LRGKSASSAQVRFVRILFILVFLVARTVPFAITDIRALRGPDIGSYHNLLKINFKVNLRVKTGNKYNEKRKMVNIFQNPK